MDDLSRLGQLERELYSGELLNDSNDSGVRVESRVESKVPVPGRVLNLVGSLYKMARSKVLDYLGKHDIKVNSGGRPIIIDKIDPKENGLINGYTDGKKIGINAYVIPENNLFYKFMKSIYSSNNPFSKYLRKIMEKPIENLYKTIVHEELHNVTQIDTGFIDNLYKATVEYLGEKLPEPFKKLAEYLANNVVIPMIEGLNEAATRQIVYKKETNEEIKKAGPIETTYDKFTVTAAEALERVGVKSPLDFYRKYIGNPWKAVKNYVKGFLDSILSPPPVYAYAKA